MLKAVLYFLLWPWENVQSLSLHTWHSCITLDIRSSTALLTLWSNLIHSLAICVWSVWSISLWIRLRCFRVIRVIRYGSLTVSEKEDPVGIEIINLSLHLWTLRISITKVHAHQQGQCYTWDHPSRHWYPLLPTFVVVCKDLYETLLISWTSAYSVRTMGLLTWFTFKNSFNENSLIIFVRRLSSYMVKPADLPEYLVHRTSKKHSPIVVPSMGAPRLVMLRLRINSEMEVERVLGVWGWSWSMESSLVDILSE